MELWIRNVTTHYPWLIRGSCWINNSKQRTKGNCYANCSPPRPDKGQITGFQFHPESLNQLPRKEDHMQSWKLPIVVVLSLDLRDGTEIIPTIPHLFLVLSFLFFFSQCFVLWLLFFFPLSCVVVWLGGVLGVFFGVGEVGFGFLWFVSFFFFFPLFFFFLLIWQNPFIKAND